MSDIGSGSGVPAGWHPEGIMAGVPDMNVAAAQSTLPAVTAKEQMGDVDWGDTQPPDGVPWTVSGQDPGLVPPGATDPINSARTPPDPAGYARDAQFHKGGTMDAQAHGGVQADGNYDFGVYNAAAGIPLSTTLDLADTYGKYFRKYPADPNDPRYKTPDKNYPNIPAVNVQNITKGHNDYQNGKLGGTD